MCSPMDEETLSSFNLTPSEMDTFTALQSFTDSPGDIHTQQQHPHFQQQLHQHLHSPQEDPLATGYLHLIDPTLLSAAPTPTSHPSANINSPDHQYNDQGDQGQCQSPFTGFDPFYPEPSSETTFSHHDRQPRNTFQPQQNNPFAQPQYSYNPNPHTLFSTETNNRHHTFNPTGPPNSLLLRHQRLGHRRSVSVPPEELMDAEEPTITFTRGSTPLGKSTTPHPSTPQRALLKAAQRKRVGAGDGGGERGSPYHKRGFGGGRGPGAGAARYELRRAATTSSANLGGGGGGGGGAGAGGLAGPTSAPLYYPPDMHAPFPPETASTQAESSGNMLGVRFSSPHSTSLLRAPPAMMVEEKTIGELQREKAWFERVDVREIIESGASAGLSTADIVLLSRLQTLSRQVEDIKDVVLRRRFHAITGVEEQLDELESLRTQTRALNATKTSLDDELETPPLALDPTANVNFLPRNGQAIKDLDVQALDSLLAMYMLTGGCSKDMFCHEKKVLWLRFLGVGGELMHLVLD